MKKLSEICIGHIATQNNKCRNCKKDEYNVFCENYKPIRLYEFDVEKKKQELRNKIEESEFYKHRFEDVE